MQIVKINVERRLQMSKSPKLSILELILFYPREREEREGYKKKRKYMEGEKMILEEEKAI